MIRSSASSPRSSLPPTWKAASTTLGLFLFVAFTEDETTELSTIEAAIDKIRDENIVKFVLGTRDLSEWDSYVTEIRNAGLDKYLDFYSKAYVRQLSNVK